VTVVPESPLVHCNSLLATELRPIATLIDIADLADVAAARITDAQVVAAVTPEGFPDLDPEDVEVTETTIIASAVHTRRAPHPVKLRIYRPRGRLPARPSGAVVFLHGGAFCLGDLETDHLRCMYYAQHASCVVVSVEYALAPEYRFPHGLDDAIAATLWVHTAAPDLGVDARALCIAGESAGGGLAAAVALWCRDTQALALGGQMLLFPALDHRLATDSMSAGATMPAWNSAQCKLMWQHYLGSRSTRVSPYASPAIAVDLSGLPPSLVVTAQVDPLRDEGIEYGHKLCAAGAATEIHNYAGTFHVFDTSAPHLPIAHRALDEQVDFISTVCEWV
jgi:acetyl esterase/lipase